MLSKVIICAILSLAIGLLCGWFFTCRYFENCSDGEIILDKNDEGDDRIIFKMGMDYDDLVKYKRIVFSIVKKS